MGVPVVVVMSATVYLHMHVDGTCVMYIDSVYCRHKKIAPETFPNRFVLHTRQLIFKLIFFFTLRYFV